LVERVAGKGAAGAADLSSSSSSAGVVPMAIHIGKDRGPEFRVVMNQRFTMVLGIDTGEHSTCDGLLDLQLVYADKERAKLEEKCGGGARFPNERWNLFRPQVQTSVQQSLEQDLPRLEKFYHNGDFANVGVTVVDHRLTVICRVQDCVQPLNTRNNNETVEVIWKFRSPALRLPSSGKATLKIAKRSKYFKEKRKRDTGSDGDSSSSSARKNRRR